MGAFDRSGRDPAIEKILANCIANRTRVRLRPGFGPCAIGYRDQRYFERQLSEVPPDELLPLFSGVEVKGLLVLDEPLITMGLYGPLETREALLFNLPHPLAHLAFAVWRFERLPK
jgi:hypothetical protein